MLKTKEKSLRKQTLSGFLWLGGIKVSNAIFQFAILAILARLLSPTEFGLMGLALIVVSFAEIFNDMGFGPAITQKKELCKTDIHTAFTYSLIFGLVLFILVQIGAPFIAGFFGNNDLIPLLRIIAVVLIINSAITTPLGLLYRRMQYKHLSLIQITSYVIGYGGVGIILAYLGFGVWSLIAAVISQSFLALCLFLFFSVKKLGFSLNKNSFKNLIHFGGGYSLSKIFSYGANKGDKVVIGKILGVDALGLYERGYQLVKYASNLLGEIIDKVLFSPIAKKQDDRKLVGAVYLELTYILAIIFFPFSAFLYSNAQQIVMIILGEQWDNTIPIVQIMSVSVFFLITTRIGSTVAKSLGDVYKRAWRTLFYAIFILLAVSVGVKWGTNGAAIAVSIGAVINYLLAYRQVQNLTKISTFSFFKKHIYGILLSGGYLILNYLSSIYLINKIENNFFILLVGILLLLIIYSVAFLTQRNMFSKYFKILK